MPQVSLLIATKLQTGAAGVRRSSGCSAWVFQCSRETLRCVSVCISFKVLCCLVEKTEVRLLLKALVFCMRHGLYVFIYELICILGGDVDLFWVSVRKKSSAKSNMRSYPPVATPL